MGELSLIKGYADEPAVETPRIGLRKMFRLALRTWPYIRPMLKHLIFLAVLALLAGGAAMLAGFMGTDIFSNKVLVGTKLQPFQATVLFVGDEYVRADVSENDSGSAAAKASGDTIAGASESEELLTEEQRKTVRNRWILWTIAGGIFGTLGVLIFPYYTMWIWQSVNQNLRVAMIERAESLSLKYHDNARVGDAIFRVYQDSAMIVNLLQSGILSPAMMLYGIGVGLVFAIAFDPMLALMIVLISVPMIWLTVIFTPRIRRKAMANRMANSDLTSRLQEVFSAIKVVKANRAEGRVFDRFNEDSTRALNTAYFLRLDMAVLTVLIAILSGVALVGAEFIMTGWVIDGRETLLGAWAAAFIGFVLWNLGAFQTARGRVDGAGRSARGLVGAWTRMQDLFIGLERAFYLLDIDPDVTDPDDPISFPSPIETVTWHHVKFAYDEAHPILTDVHVQAAVGTITAIVGATGAGKSTVMSLLLRLYDPDAGQVLVNDIDIRDMAIDDIRGNTAIALQKNVLFADTVAKNIAYSSPRASREEIELAARVACADDFIQAMPKGYDTELGERGGKLSAGQRQRLSIARAVIRDTPILILDEPSASLDAKTEHRVLSNLSEWGKGKVTFLITHRLSTIRNADHIAFLEDGKILEYGNHDELMAKEDGHYRAFVEAEVVGVSPQEEGDKA